MWCCVVSWILGIKSYLLGADAPVNEDDPNQVQPNPPAQAVPELGGGLAAHHQALLQRDVPVSFQPYDRPSCFALRLIGLLMLMAISLVFGSLVTLTVPVWMCRHGMAIWSMGSSITADKALIVEEDDDPVVSFYY